ncbi:MAG: PilZ domain-containing protein [Acidimicrobiales bacterium]
MASTAAMATGALYLGWRLTTLGSGPLWLSLPLFVLEVWGFVLLIGVLVRAWPRAAVEAPARPDHFDGPLAIAVTAGVASADDVERTLLGCHRLERDLTVTVIDRHHRDDVAALCAELGATYRSDGGATGADSFLEVASDQGQGILLWLDGGQIPLPGIVESGLARLGEPRTAVVQVSRQLLNDNSLVAMDRGGDPELIDDAIIGPRLGTRGLAPWLGPGSFARCEALVGAGRWAPGDPAALHRSAVRLQGAGWRTVHERRPLVGVKAPDSLDEYLGHRRRRALAAYRFLLTADNPLIAAGLTPHQRVVALSDALGHTAGLRQLGLTALLVVVLVTGQLPLDTSIPSLLSWWFPAWILGHDARRRASADVLGRGDPIRHAWRGVEAELSALHAIVTAHLPPARSRPHPTALGMMRVALTTAVVLNVAIVVQAIGSFWPIVPSVSPTARLVVLGVAVSALFPLVDVLQLTARRRQRRRSHRRAVSRPVAVDGMLGRTVDLNVDGLGIVGIESEIGATHALSFSLPIGSDPEVNATAVVRSVAEAGAGTRLGLEFVALAPEARRCIIDFCLQEARAQDGAERLIAEIDDLEPATPMRRATAAMSVVGVVAGVVAMIAGPASAAPVSLVDGAACLVDSAGRPVAGAAIDYHDDRWAPFGTTDDDGCVEGPVPHPSGATFRYTLDGRVIQVSPSTLADHKVVTSAVPLTVRLVDSTGKPLPGADVEFYGGTWRYAGTTGVDGTVVTELLPARTSVRVTYEGRSDEQEVDMVADPTAIFATTAVTIRFTDSTGAPTTGGRVEYLGGSWRLVGTTGIGGSVVQEMLPARTTFQVTFEDRTFQQIVDVGAVDVVDFATVPVTVSLDDTQGRPVTGAEAFFHSGEWRRMGRTGADGTVGREVLPGRITFRVDLGGLSTSRSQDVTRDAHVRFGTGRIAAADGTTVVERYAGAWIPFEDGAEILPALSAFRLADGSTIKLAPMAGQTLLVPSGEILGRETSGGWTTTTTMPTTSSAPSSSRPARRTTADDARATSDGIGGFDGALGRAEHQGRTFATRSSGSTPATRSIPSGGAAAWPSNR